MKNKLKSIFLLALSAGVLATSCSEDDHTGASMINYTSPTVTLSTASTSVVVDESMIDPDLGYVIEVTASIPEPVFVDLHIPLVQTGGTADSSDFTAGTIVITSGHTSASANVTIWRECESGVEGDETLEISFADNIANAKMSPFSMDISIENDWVNDLIEITFDWSGELTYDSGLPSENTIDFCSIDIDYIITDDLGNALGYIAGTGDCPEIAEVSGLADGTYFIIAELYDQPFSAPEYDGPLTTIPQTVTWMQCGFPATTGEFSNELLTTATPTGDVLPIAVLEVTGGYNYTVSPF
ncbi:hypothetical protein [Xanthomarina gelatinilytica]|uniref:hypothetical protein n=1 Tax=Xanthomarina gelatinilytica TaxID=1137281 RepID=UPI003AA7AC7C